MARRLRSAIELVSDIGGKGFDLQHHSEREIAEAVVFLRMVNAPMFDWLIKVLAAPPARDAVDPHVTDTGKPPTRDKCSSCSAAESALSVLRASLHEIEQEMRAEAEQHGRDAQNARLNQRTYLAGEFGGQYAALLRSADTLSRLVEGEGRKEAPVSAD